MKPFFAALRAVFRRSGARHTRAFVGLSVLSVVLTWGGVLSARPTLWQRVKQPQAERVAELIRRAERARSNAEEEPTEAWALSQKLSERSAVLLTLSHAGQLNDSELNYLLADCFARAGSGSARDAAQALSRALRAAPEHPLAASAWRQLATALGRQGDHDRARVALQHALRTEWDQEARALIYTELGRSFMHSGLLAEAIEHLEIAVSEAPSSEVWALAAWSLGVAHDRNFDFPEAVKHVIPASQARFGPSGVNRVIELPGVEEMLGPDKFYYLGLELLAQVNAATNASEAQQRLLAAQLMWLGYQRTASSSDPCGARVEQHVRDIRQRLDTPEDPDALDRDALRPPDFGD